MVAAARSGPAEQGVGRGDRHLAVPRVLVFPRRRDGHVLLLRGAPDKKTWAGRYNGFGGHVEAGEDPLTAARRELREESGIDLPFAAFRLAVIVTIDLPGPGVLLFVFSAEVPDTAPPVAGSVEGTPEWHRVDTVATLPAVEDLPWLVSTVFGGRPGPVFARYSYDASNVLEIGVADDLG
ncbi:NUDIX hydrolase [Actinophytocola oryzae]|uniref:8-oxo-dGTP diphosphatase n=1 Tax=Actinophytocola oryzae TaxID=502181 RepID=A0A4R7USB3_9PSEU|nr:NUDIX domain-containing protein [Actinophytocola oryzae]TDV36824.1 8-oxo-dGTP diphosphatase [Actinophytocola oryzae]